MHGRARVSDVLNSTLTRDGREIALLHAGICDRRMWDEHWADAR